MSRALVALVTRPGPGSGADLAREADLNGRTSEEWVAEAARQAGCEAIEFESQDPPDRSALAKSLSGSDALLLVLPAEAPLLHSGLLKELRDAALAGGSARLFAGRSDVPVDAGVVALSSSRLGRALEASPDTPIRDLAFALVEEDGAQARTVELGEDGIGTQLTGPLALTHIRSELRRRRLEELMVSGVDIRVPERTMIDANAVVEPGTTLHADVTILGTSRVGAGSELHQGVWLRDSQLAPQVTVLPYSVLEGAVVGENASVGPFARLRPGTVLERDVKVGNFVEIKKTTLGRGSKASHLTYLGDATLGEDVNIGAGTITCNYDGTNKHQTTIGDGVFVGSDTMLVAPVTLGDGAATGAGSTITRDIPAGALAVARARQKNLEGRAGQKKKASSGDKDG